MEVVFSGTVGPGHQIPDGTQGPPLSQALATLATESMEAWSKTQKLRQETTWKGP